MIARTGIISNFDKEKKRVTLIWDDGGNVSLPLLMLKNKPDSCTVTDYAAGTCVSKVTLPQDCICTGDARLICQGCPGVPIIGRRAVAVMLDGSGHGVYLGMIDG